MQPDTDALVRNFHDNLNFFERAHPALHQKLMALETALVKGYYAPVYELVFEQGYFEVIRTATNEPYYGRNSSIHAEEAAEAISGDKNAGIFEAHAKPLCEGDDFSDVLANHTNAVCAFARYAAEATRGLGEMAAIRKFIFIGVGLGLHLSVIHRKVRSGAYLIVEDDLELFRLSLFTTRYAELAETGDLEFSVFENGIEFDRTVSSFLNKGFFFNHTIKYHYMAQHSAEKIKWIQHAILTQRHFVFAFNNFLESTLKPLDYIRQGYPFLDISRQHSPSPFGEKPVLFVGAGPSLQKNSEWLQKNHASFLIAAASASLRPLRALGIAPDMVIHIDGFEASKHHYEGFGPEDFADTLFIGRANSYEGILPYFRKENVVLFEMGSSYYEGIGSLATPCVGSSSYLLLSRLGTRRLYVLGLDLALDQESGSTHSDSHMHNKTLDLATADRIETEASARTMLLAVRGNFAETVMTTPHFKQSLDDLYLFAPEWIGTEEKIYNLARGAYLPGSEAKEAQSVHEAAISPEERARMQEALREFLRAHSRSAFTANEKEAFDRRLAYAAEVREAIRRHAQGNEQRFDTYQAALFELLKRTIGGGSPERDDLGQVMLRYYKLVLTYVFDLFNTKGVNRHEAHVANIRILLCEHLGQIVDRYETRLRSFLDH